MAEILTDHEINQIRNRANVGITSDVLALIASHRALAAENDNLRHGLDEEGLSLSERCCGSVKGTLSDRIAELEAQVRELTEERDRLEEDAELAAEDADRLRAELKGVYGAMLTEGNKRNG